MFNLSCSIVSTINDFPNSPNVLSNHQFSLFCYIKWVIIKKTSHDLKSCLAHSFIRISRLMYTRSCWRHLWVSSFSIYCIVHFLRPFSIIFPRISRKKKNCSFFCFSRCAQSSSQVTGFWMTFSRKYFLQACLNLNMQIVNSTALL